MNAPMTNMPRDEFEQLLPELVIEALNRNGKRRYEFFTDTMNMARSYDLESAALQIAKSTCIKEGEPMLWETPKDFNGVRMLPLFPIDSLPSFLGEYLKAVCYHIQVFPEMAVLPLLSALSLCVQGKAMIYYPGNNHTEPLNIYTLTVAAPGERKSGVMRELTAPIQKYQDRWNDTHKSLIAKYHTEKAFLEQRKAEAMRGKNANIDLAKEYTQKLLELEEISEMKLTVKDTTPEALARELYLHGERMGILDDEGSVFDVLAGLYSNGQSNINIFLEGYDGSPYSIARATKEDIVLHSPLLTLGLMVQPSHFMEAMNNKQFSGRGFIHRFLFSFPQSKSGSLTFETPNIPVELRTKYNDLITGLLVLPYPDDPPVIHHSQGSKYLFREYFEHLQEGLKPGGIFEAMKEWTAKQLSRALRIAGIFHICKYGEKFAGQSIDTETAKAAISIAQWSEAHAVKALSGDGVEGEITQTAKQIIEKLKKIGKETVSRSELINAMRGSHRINDLVLPLELLEDMKYIRLTDVSSGSKGGRTKQNIEVNPQVFI